MWSYMDHNMTFGHGLGMIVFWILIIGIALIFFSKVTNNNDEETALNILKKRLAKGEISIEEYKKLKQSL